LARVNLFGFIVMDEIQRVPNLFRFLLYLLDTPLYREYWYRGTRPRN
jgi:predicted AAA+ superfamily ATPase